MRRSVKQQTGITLIEILVTMIIMAIGFLGLASVQLMGTKNVTNSNYRTLATIYAYDMVERMRSNQKGVRDNSYDDVETATATDPGCGSTCDSAQMADLDAFEWKSLLEAPIIDGGLPSGSGTVEYDATDDVYNIEVSWTEVVRTADTQDEATQTLTLAVKL